MLNAECGMMTYFTGGCGVRVSGGHLCEAEAPTEPAGETHPPLQILFFILLCNFLPSYRLLRKILRLSSV